MNVMTALRIERRFCGPDDSGNGGYVAGCLGGLLEGCVTVRLMRPPPLEQDMTVVADATGLLTLRHGDIDIASARPGQLELEPPVPVPFDEAVVSSKRYSGFKEHVFPHCFVCGPARRPGDGLCIYAGPVAGRQHTVASPWQPDQSLDAGDGRVEEKYLWAALDCPGAFTRDLPPGIARVLGEMTVQVLQRPRIGEHCVAMGWALGSEGRKYYAGTAVFDGSGQLCGIARETWIEIPQSN